MYLGLLGNTPLEKENWGRSYKKKSQPLIIVAQVMCARQYSMHFLCINSFHSHKSPLRHHYPILQMRKRRCGAGKQSQIATAKQIRDSHWSTVAPESMFVIICHSASHDK